MRETSVPGPGNGTGLILGTVWRTILKFDIRQITGLLISINDLKSKVRTPHRPLAGQLDKLVGDVGIEPVRRQPRSQNAFGDVGHGTGWPSLFETLTGQAKKPMQDIPTRPTSRVLALRVECSL